MSMPTDRPLQKEPFFKGAFFWYVILQVTVGLGYLTAIFVYFFVIGIIYMDNPSAFQAQLEFVSKATQPMLSAITIALCITVARRHHTGFWRGVLLFFAGNFVATIVSLPLIVVSFLTGEGSLGWLGVLLLLLLLYWIGCIVLIVRRRRKEAASRVQRQAIAAFE